jgi:LPXTG-motif cell wall-anchored protein
VFTKQADGLLSDKVTVGLSPDGRTVTFTWPSDGNRMKPGEVFKVRLFLELQAHSADPASVVITADTTIAIGVDNRFDKPLPATGGSSALVLGVSGFGIAGVIVGIVLLTRRRRREV